MEKTTLDLTNKLYRIQKNLSEIQLKLKKYGPNMTPQKKLESKNIQAYLITEKKRIQKTLQKLTLKQVELSISEALNRG